jgi:hypothetical protein
MAKGAERIALRKADSEQLAVGRKKKRRSALE